MGIADRDYARTGGGGGWGSGSGGAWGGRGPSRGFRDISMTGWLIAINVLVFILGNVVLRNVTTDVSEGMFWGSSASKEQIARAVVRRDIGQFPMGGGPKDSFYYPAIDPVTGQRVGGLRMQKLPIFEAYGPFSTGKVVFNLEVWRVLTFQFLHANLTHIVFNMLGLWFVGSLVEQYLGGKRYLAFYLLCGIFGALSYLFLNVLGYIVMHLWPNLPSQVPALLFEDIYTPLVGASAGVFGVLMAAAFIAPNATVLVMFVLPMKLRTAVYFFVAIAVVNLMLSGDNKGGEAAHIGGVISGAYFIRHTHLLREFFDIFGNSRKAASRVVRPLDPGVSDVDRILTKVRAEGLESLTAAERATLRRASQSG